MTRKNPEIADLITERLLSGQMTAEEWEDLRSTDCPEDADAYQWYENGVFHRKWNSGYREYKNEATNWKWRPYRK